MFRFIVATVALAVLAMLTGCQDDAEVPISQLGAYDDFSGNGVDSSKWSTDNTGGGSLRVSNGTARMSIATAGTDVQSSLLFPTGLVGRIGTVKARVTLTSYSEAAGIVRFRLYTRPYKDNALASAGLTSDIFAQLRIRNGQFEAMVSRCTDSVCASTPIFGPTSIGSASLGKAYDLSLSWNGKYMFRFAVDGLGSTAFDASVGGTFSRVGPSGGPRAKVEVIADTVPTGNASAKVDWVVCQRWDYGLC